jgi:tripartite-type tricarboxylate transporter receptor subunit TctC
MLYPTGMPSALAQAYPNKPIRLLLGYAPGGPSDLAARLLGPHLNQALGQPLVIDNRPGAGGSLATWRKVVKMAKVELQ